MTTTPDSSASSRQAAVDVALLVLKSMGLSPDDLTAAPANRGPVPTFAEYVPVVSGTVTAGTLRAYRPYWRKVVEHWGGRRLDEPTPSEIKQLVASVRAGAVPRRNSRGGRSAGENLISALRPLRLLGRRAPLREGRRADTTRERWQQVHDLRSQGVGLLDCARRLGLSLNTVKRYDRAGEPERLQRVPKYRPTLVDPYRDYLRKRRSEEPGVPVQQLLREIRELGYQGSSNLLVRYLNQGRADAERPHLSPRRAARILLTRPDNRTGAQRETAERLASACPEMKALDDLIASFAAILAPHPADEGKPQQWIAGARAADLPNLHSFTRGLDLDIKAATAAVTRTYHNGRTEGVNNKTKKIKRDMFGRAGFGLLRHRILLGLRHGRSPPEVRQSR